MKFRSAQQLLAHLDDEMAWRLKEIHELRSAVISAKGKNVDAHIRAGISMLYAHWEGFVKGAANAYISYLSFRADLNKDLQTCFVALGVKHMLATAQESSKSIVAISALSQILSDMDKPIRLPKADAISAKSNLSSSVFTNIAGWIGISVTKYEPRFPLIDKSLLENRNCIAHGEYLLMDDQRFGTLTTEVLELLRWFKTDIENAVVTQAFLKTSAAAAPIQP